MADGIPPPSPASNIHVIAFERLQPCDVQWFERITLGMRLRGVEIACDSRSQRTGILKRLLEKSDEPSRKSDSRGEGKSLAKRFCGDWRHAA